MFHFLVFIVLFLFTTFSFGLDTRPSLYVSEWYNFLDHQTLLLEDLFRNYDPTVAPVYTKINVTSTVEQNPLEPEPFNYTVFLFYMKLIDVQEPEEKISLVLELAEHWYDPRLVWEPSKYNNIETIHVRQGRVWSPTLTAFGINDIADFRDQDYRMVAVESTGHVYTALSVKISSNCRMNVARFPFDSQTCLVQFFMPVFYQKHVKLLHEVYVGILNKTVWDTIGNSEWDMVNVTSRIEMLTFVDSLGNVELATFEVKIRRNPMYYIYMIVFPSFIINVLSIIGVFMRKTDMMSKLNVGLTNIMTMTFILGVMADKIPRTGYIPLLGIYIIINLFIMIIAVGITILIEDLKKCAKSKQDKKGNEQVKENMKFLQNHTLETLGAIALEFATVANFSVMIFFWICDS